MRKITLDNYKELIDRWVVDVREDDCIFLPDDELEKLIIKYAWEKNLVINIVEYEIIYKRLKCKHHIR